MQYKRVNLIDLAVCIYFSMFAKWLWMNRQEELVIEVKAIWRHMKKHSIGEEHSYEVMALKKKYCILTFDGRMGFLTRNRVRKFEKAVLTALNRMEV